MPKRKTIIDVQGEMPHVLVLKYKGATAVTVKYECGHVREAFAGHLRKGKRCGGCHGSAQRSMQEHQADLDDLLVLKVDGASAVTVKSPICNHVWTERASRLRKGKRCIHCSPRATKSVLAYQAEFPDVLVLKVENAKAVTVKSPICGHLWTTQANDLRKGHRCSRCAQSGYKTDKPGFLYFMERPGEMQIGITNVPDERLATHAREGWELVEIDGPHCGQEILDRETAIKKHLRENDLLIKGTHENWATAMWSPHSLAAIEQAAQQLVAA